jgi:hypothetical protein
MPNRLRLSAFRDFGTPTRLAVTRAETARGPADVPTFINEFWTSKQRAANSLHEVSYRACFKPQLPRFFIERLTDPGDVVYDPFAGRGTTILEAALMGRTPIGCDASPLSAILSQPRLRPPRVEQVASRLRQVPFHDCGELSDDLLVFYHADTLREVCGLRRYLLRREADGALDDVDRWIRMVAVNRLTGHSRGFFSVYTLPPNQAVSIESQRKINARRGQAPPRRIVAEIILRKSRSLLKDCSDDVRARLASAMESARAVHDPPLLTSDAAAISSIPSDSVHLVVTSPPFLDVVDYAQDNWLRCWFCGIDPLGVRLAVHRRLEDWQAAMTAVFRELRRVLVPGGHVAFEVGEVRGGEVRLEETALACGVAAGFEPRLVLINDQEFTKTAHCWGVDNRRKGTNTNRVAVFQRPR